MKTKNTPLLTSAQAEDLHYHISERIDYLDDLRGGYDAPRADRWQGQISLRNLVRTIVVLDQLTCLDIATAKPRSIFNLIDRLLEYSDFGQESAIKAALGRRVMTLYNKAAFLMP